MGKEDSKCLIPFVRALIQWTPDYAVGVRQIDEEHQRLFSLVDQMHRAMLEGKGKAILADLLVGLVEYTCDHFTHEERLMERIRYPEFRQHRQLHEDLRFRVRAIERRLASGEMTMTIESCSF